MASSKEDYFPHHLKTLSTQQIEEYIEDALMVAVAAELDCHIEQIEFRTGTTGGTHIVLTISNKLGSINESIEAREERKAEFQKWVEAERKANQL